MVAKNTEQSRHSYGNRQISTYPYFSNGPHIENDVKDEMATDTYSSSPDKSAYSVTWGWYFSSEDHTFNNSKGISSQSR